MHTYKYTCDHLSIDTLEEEAHECIHTYTHTYIHGLTCALLSIDTLEDEVERHACDVHAIHKQEAIVDQDLTAL
jgi:hypothetical protein